MDLAGFIKFMQNVNLSSPMIIIICLIFLFVFIRIILVIVFTKVYKVSFQKAVDASVQLTSFGKHK